MISVDNKKGLTPHHFSRRKSDAGFIALISAIIIAATLLVLVTTIGFSGFFGRFSILESEIKEHSTFLAEACVNTAILKISQDVGYTGVESISVGSEICDIRPVQVSGTDRIIETQGVYRDAYTNLRVTVDTVDPLIPVVAWEEVPMF